MSIDVQQPRPYDLVTDAVQIAGMAGGAFEATFNYRIHEGHDEVTGFFTAGDGAGGPSARTELDKVVVPAILGPKIVIRGRSDRMNPPSGSTALTQKSARVALTCHPSSPH